MAGGRDLLRAGKLPEDLAAAVERAPGRLLLLHRKVRRRHPLRDCSIGRAIIRQLASQRHAEDVHWAAQPAAVVHERTAEGGRGSVVGAQAGGGHGQSGAENE